MDDVYCVEDSSIRKGVAYFKCGTDGVLHREDGPAYCYSGSDKKQPNQVAGTVRLRQISNYILAEKKDGTLNQEWWWHGEKMPVANWLDRALSENEKAIVLIM